MFSYVFGQLGRSRGFPQTFLRRVSMIVVKTSAVVSVASLIHISIVFAFCTILHRFSSNDEKTGTTGERRENVIELTSLVYRSLFQFIQYHYQHRPPIPPHPAPRMQMNRADQANQANSANLNRIAPIPRQRTIFLIPSSNRDDRTHSRTPSPVDR